MRSEDIHSLYPETLVIGTNVTALVSPLPGQIACTVKYGSGGTLYFAGATLASGSSFATAQLYPLGAAEIFSFDSAGYFKLRAEGATVTCYMVRSRSAGFDQT